MLQSVGNLMPWPGPQVTPLMATMELPCPIEMQSSPVPTKEEEMVTPEERSMWMPSVFGLSAGADIRRLSAVKLEQLTMPIWNSLLSTEFMCLTTVLFIPKNLRDCQNNIYPC